MRGCQVRVKSHACAVEDSRSYSWIMKTFVVDLVVTSLCLFEAGKHSLCLWNSSELLTSTVLLVCCGQEILLGNKNQVSSCYSTNDTAVFVCTVIDANHYYGTDWSGTVFNCPSVNSISNNMIFLPHQQFSSIARGTCNDGTIVAEGTEVNGSLYTSTLTIAPVMLDMNGQTIICSISGITIFGTETLRVGGKYK